MVAVIGARRATVSGRRVAYEIGQALAREGIVVTSGMALGIDAAAHEGALDAGGLTVAVLGSGVDRPTPRAHSRLHARIVRSGLSLSEFLPGAPAARHHFPRRNRVIAALTSAVVVVEAGRRSGALITVDHALDLGRSVYAVPGPLDRPQSDGTNALIRDGAGVVTSVEELADQLREEYVGTVAALSSRANPPSSDPPAQACAEGSAELDRLGRLVRADPGDLSKLVRRSGLSCATVAAAMVELELAGAVRMEGARFRWTGR